jgi:hypothetical protein
MARAVLFDAPGPPGAQGKPGLKGAQGIPGLGISVSVKDYGSAFNDPAVDNGAAINKAIQALQALLKPNSNGTVLIPWGTYYVQSTINLATGITLTGEARPHWNGVGEELQGSWLRWAGGSSGTMISGVGIQDVHFQNLGVYGAQVGVNTQVGLYIAGQALVNDGHGNFIGATQNVHVHDCVFIQCGTCILWGEGGVTGYQADSSSIERCTFNDFYNYGVHIQSTNAFDASHISNCVGNSVGLNAFLIYVQAAGNMAIRDCDSSGSNVAGSGFCRINASTNPVTIEDCECESCDYFLYVPDGASDGSVVNLIGNYTNLEIYLGTIVRVVGLGNIVTGNIVLDHAGAKYLGFGDRTTPTCTVTINAGVYHNQDLTGADQGINSYHPLGKVIWTPSYWQGSGIAAEVCTVAGFRGTHWSASTSYAAGSVVYPTSFNGHVYVSNGGISNTTTQPTWPTGASSTVADGSITWTESGPQAIFKAFGRLETDLRWTPGLTKNLVGWWRGDLGVTASSTASGTVTLWADQSGNGFDLSQSTTSGRPNWSYNNGLGYMQFDNTQHMGLSNSSFTQLTQPFDIFMVAELDAGFANAYLMDFANGNTSIFYAGSDNLSLSAGLVGTGAAISTSVTFIGEAVFSGTASIAALNGVPTTVSPGTTSPGATGISVGNYYAALTVGWVGKIYEVLVFSKKLSDTDRDSVVRYLKNRYGVS